MSLRKALIILLFVFMPTCVMAESVPIGFAAPVEGTFAAVARQMLAGANAAATAHGVTLTIADEACTPEGGQKAAEQFVAAHVQAVAGFACLESLSAALPILTKADIPVLTTGVRADSVIESKTKTEFKVFRLGPADRMEAEALAGQLLARWQATPFAIIDDGTVHSRDMAESLRAAATEKGLKPVFFDTFRPGLDNQSALARRLAKAGAMAIFMGGDVEDALVLSRNAVDLGLTFELALGESPAASAPPPGTVLSLSLPEYALTATAVPAVRALQQGGTIAENTALTAYAAIEVLASVAKAQGADVTAKIGSGQYKTAIGEVTFDASGERSGNPFKLQPVDTAEGLPAQ